MKFRSPLRGPWLLLAPPPSRGPGLDDPATRQPDRVLLAPPPVDRGDVNRDDTAAVLVALLDTPTTAGRILALRAGDTAVLDAVSAFG